MKISNYTKRFLLVMLCLSLLLSHSMISPAQAADCQKAYHWYVKRNHTHAQPTVDSAQADLEKYDAYYVDKKCGEGDNGKVIYLTFDVGYENGNVAKILDTLRDENVPAAFFILKNVILKEPSLLERMVSEGHLVCNHTMSHRDMSRLSDAEFAAELNGLVDLYREQTGKEMAPYYRPPEGTYSKSNLMQAQKMGYKTIFWSFAYADWDNDKQPSEEAAKKKIRENMHPGAVLLLHPTSATNAAILGELIREWKAEGYRFGTLEELVAART